MFSRVISAKESTERRKSVEKELVKIGLVPHYFDAIMGRHIPEKQLRYVSHVDNGLTVGEIGCVLSHLGVYEQLLATDEPAALVFEDDVIVSEEFSNDQLQGIYQYFLTIKEPAILLLYESQHAKQRVAKVLGVSVFKAFTGSGAYAYFINRKAAESVRRIQQPIHFVQDIYKYYAVLGQVDLYTLDSAYCQHGGEDDSLLETERKVYIEEYHRDKLRKKMYKKCFNQLPFFDKLYAIYWKVEKSAWELFHKI